MPRKKGFSFKSAKVIMAPDEYKIKPPEMTSLMPAAKTTGFKARVGEGNAPPKPAAARGLFAGLPKVKAPPKRPVAVAPLKVTAPAAAAAATPAPATAAAAATFEEVEAPPQPMDDLITLLAEEEAQPQEALPVPQPTLPEDLAEMKELIEEEGDDLYTTEVPTAYIPQTRRGFAEFIRQTYRTFELPEGAITVPEGDKYYPYQKFVRDYMRQESPYRGVLVYHGLGSGKTCTSIATAEALFAASGKKIIVMANYSLKKNFFSEVSKCGFRHFQLNNYWVPLSTSDDTHILFANKVLGIPASHLKRAQHIWVPDFRRPPEQANYKNLSPEDRDEIRKQILSILEWDPVKNPEGRIRFIAYNGISAKKLLQMACSNDEEKFFDNAVIVIDEIHNLIRNIQGKIQPYFEKLATAKRGTRRVIPIETVDPLTRWKPTVCDTTTKLYNRGYLFYRLLLDARNSKIVGLSGTPLINFPEELGILANVLHGYIPVGTGIIAQTGDKNMKSIEKIGHTHPFIDYIKAKQDPTGAGIVVTFTLLPAGIRKISVDVGVERIPPEEVAPTMEEIVESIAEAFKAANLPFKSAISMKSEPLLPPFGDEFKESFLLGEKSELKNNIVLITRLTGLISYYKGSQLELMPRVVKDEVVRVPFSLYAQKAYSVRRAAEILKEMEKSGGKESSVDQVWAKIYQLGDSAAANNYKMASRQACNFAFPPEVVRPAPKVEEALEEAAEGLVEKDLDTVPEPTESSGEELAFETGEEGGDAIEAAEAAAEEAAILAKMGIGSETQSGGGDDEDAEEDALSLFEGGGDNDYDEYGSSAAADQRPPPADPIGEAAESVIAIATGEAPAVPAAAPAAEKEEESIEFSVKINNEYKVFDNLVETPFKINEKEYPTVEHYYQSMKFEGVNPDYQEKVRKAEKAIKAIMLAKTGGVPIRTDFDEVKEAIMEQGLRAKFTQNLPLKQLLLSTGNKRLVYLSTNDTYWGITAAEKKGKNRLSDLLEKLRADFRVEEERDAAVEAMLGPAPKAAPKMRVMPIKRKAPAAPAPAAAAAPAFEDCKAGTKPGEKYKDACARAKQCLATIAKEHMTLGGPDGLEIYSPKYAAMLQRIQDASGSSLVYSQFLDMEGIGIFRIAMDANGYAPIEIVPMGGTYAFSKATEASFRNGKQMRYITFSGGEDPKVRSLALDLFNAKLAELTEPMLNVLREAGYEDNKVGEICRVFCITSAGAEGLSLRNVRAVHIMEPYWNEVRLRQVKGRAIRIGSHLDLPEEERNVCIYTYVSVFPEKAQESKAGEYRVDETLLRHDSVDAVRAAESGIPIKDGLRSYILTTDEMMYSISERKRRVIEGLEKVMKAAAVDCELNYKQNKDGEDFYCSALKGKVGDFVYTPFLKDDIAAAASFRIQDRPPVAPTAPAAPPVGAEAPLEPGEFHKLFKKVLYIMKPTLGPEGSITGFRMLDPKTRKLKGYAAAKDGKPAPPVDFLPDTA